jgi:hypothetical protein
MESYLSPVSMDDNAFDEICNRVYESYENSCICSIDEVKNIDLLKKYEAYISENKCSVISNFHGTSYYNTSGIIVNGFKTEKNVRSVFGVGTYTAKDAKYSFNYMKDTDSMGLSYMFLCDVAIIKMGIISDPTKKLTDTLVNRFEDSTIYVTRNEDAIYPRYLIAFYKNASF